MLSLEASIVYTGVEKIDHSDYQTMFMMNNTFVHCISNILYSET